MLQECLPQTFAGLCDEVTASAPVWQQWFDSPAPHETPIPEPLRSKLTPFQQLLILKVFRYEKLVFAFTAFVAKNLGKKFITNPPIHLETVFNETSPATPIIFVLSQGADPTSFLITFAEERGFGSRLNMISLGQGQVPFLLPLSDSSLSLFWLLFAFFAIPDG